jgi:hypothetical protein
MVQELETFIYKLSYRYYELSARKHKIH